MVKKDQSEFYRAFGLALWIALFAFLLKWPVFCQPLSGYFGSYQAVNAMMADMMGRGNWQDFVTPRLFNILDNAPALHLLYYPFGSLSAWILNGFLGIGIPFAGRLQAGLFVLAASMLFFFVARRFLSDKKTVFAVFVFSFSPMVLLSGIVLQNEAAALFFLLLAFWLLASSSLGAIILSGLVFSLALTARIHFIVALPALLLYLNRKKFSFSRSMIFLAAVALLVSAWYAWMRALEIAFPTQVQTSLFSQTGDGRMMRMDLLTSLTFYKRLLIILGTYCCTPVIMPFVLWGLFRFRSMDRSLLAWGWGTLALIVLLPQKVADHPFYLIVGAPVFATIATMQLGVFWKQWRNWLRVLFCVVFVLLSLRFYLPPAFHLSASDKKIVRIGGYVNKMTKEQDKIIAQHGSSPDLLYYTGRFGWAFDLDMKPQKNHIETLSVTRLKRAQYGNPIVWLEKLRSEGASYLVISEPDKFDARDDFSGYVRDRYSLVTDPSESFFVFKLRES